MLTGPNVKLGQTVGQTAIGNATKTLQYNSCNIASALNALGSLQPVRNGWSDNDPSY